MAETIPKFIYDGTTITLDHPLVKNDPYKINTIRTDDFSRTGRKQSLFDYNEEIKEIEAGFLTQSLVDSLRTMYLDWASEGKEFDYYPDKDSGTFQTVTMVEKTFAVTRQRQGMSFFKVKFNIRKVI